MTFLLGDKLVLVLGVVVVGVGDSWRSLVSRHVVVLLGHGLLVELVPVAGGLGHVESFEDVRGLVATRIGCQLSSLSLKIALIDCSGIEVAGLE